MNISVIFDSDHLATVAVFLMLYIALANIPEMEEHQHQHRVTVNTNIAHYVGEEKGIQGHQNSCYLDATVFGLFSLSHEFDEMFLRDKDSRVGQILWQKIVNPLRM